MRHLSALQTSQAFASQVSFNSLDPLCDPMPSEATASSQNAMNYDDDDDDDDEYST